MILELSGSLPTTAPSGGTNGNGGSALLREPRQTDQTAQREGPLTLTALWVFCTQSKEARLAFVTAGSLHMLLAAALPCNQPQHRIVMRVAHATIKCTVRVTVACWKAGRGWHQRYKQNGADNSRCKENPEVKNLICPLSNLCNNSLQSSKWMVFELKERAALVLLLRSLQIRRLKTELTLCSQCHPMQSYALLSPSTSMDLRRGNTV